MEKDQWIEGFTIAKNDMFMHKQNETLWQVYAVYFEENQIILFSISDPHFQWVGTIQELKRTFKVIVA